MLNKNLYAGMMLMWFVATTGADMADPKIREYLESHDRRITQLGDQRDLNGLQALGERIQAERRAGDANLYGRLMLRLVGELHSRQFDDEGRKMEIAGKYTHLALEKAAQLPAEVETDLVSYLEGELIAVSRKKDIQRRSAIALLYFQAWKRVADAIDPNWDPVKDAPSEVERPMDVKGGGGGASGMSPDSIKDPVIRARYVKAIEKRKQQTLKMVQQLDARKLEANFAPVAERALVAAYSYPPYASNELESLLDKYVPDKVTRDRISRQVGEAAANFEKKVTSPKTERLSGG